MAGYVESYFEQYTTAMGCGVNQPNINEESNDCALYVVVGVVLLMLTFDNKKTKVSQ